tara:strand:+ start:9798 stop:10553 length:756 start_codon:yes stop_codon:yes gene_type:complete
MVATAAAVCLVSDMATAQTDASLERLERAIERGATVAGGLVGATAIHLESGRTVSVNGDEAFPMASTYKVPIAIELLTRADAGTLSLDEMLDVMAADLHPGSGTLSPLLAQPGVSLSVRNLMELMLRISDNSATDMLLARAGGSEAVTGRMRMLGIDGIRVDRPTAVLIADRYGATLPRDREVNRRLEGPLAAGVQVPSGGGSEGIGPLVSAVEDQRLDIDAPRRQQRHVGIVLRLSEPLVPAPASDERRG